MLIDEVQLTPAQERFLTLFPHATPDDLEDAEMRHQKWHFRNATAPLVNRQRLLDYRAARAQLEHCVFLAFSDMVPAILRKDPRVITSLGKKLLDENLLHVDDAGQGFLYPRLEQDFKVAC